MGHVPQHQINIVVSDVKTKAFQMGSYRHPQTTQLEIIYLPCNRHGLVPAIAEDETSKIKLHDCYLLIGKFLGGCPRLPASGIN